MYTRCSRGDAWVGGISILAAFSWSKTTSALFHNEENGEDFEWRVCDRYSGGDSMGRY